MSEIQSKGHVSESEARAVAEASRETTWEAPSFVRELFLGKVARDLVHPHPEPDSEEQKLAATCMATACAPCPISVRLEATASPPVAVSLMVQASCAAIDTPPCP